MMRTLENKTRCKKIKLLFVLSLHLVALNYVCLIFLLYYVYKCGGQNVNNMKKAA